MLTKIRLAMSALAFCALAAGALVGCAWRPPSAAAPASAASEPASTADVSDVPAVPASPAAQQQAQRLALAAVELLEAGNEDQARSELLRALSLDSNNKLAPHLLRQMSADPVTALGRESFPYVVKPGETLSRIAQRHLGDVYAFYLLARYNDIKVPRQLSGGQVIRLPGKAPAPERDTRRPDNTAVPRTPAPAPAEPPAAPPAAAAASEPSVAERALRAAEAAEKAGDLDRALAEYRKAAELPGATAKAEQLRRQLVARHTVGARTAFAKQDLDGTILQWDRVLELDPGNETARLERKKAIGLKERLQSVK